MALADITRTNGGLGPSEPKGALETIVSVVKETQLSHSIAASNGIGPEPTFACVPLGLVDPDEVLLRKLRADISPEKVDLMAGVYRSEQGTYYEFEVVRKAKQILAVKDLGHDVRQ